MSDPNLSEADCLAKAREFDERARQARISEAADGYRLIAESYRLLARLKVIEPSPRLPKCCDS